MGRRSGINPHDPNCRWLLAAEMAAHAMELSRWDWSVEKRQTADPAGRLADRVYEGAGADEPAPLFEQLSGLFREQGEPHGWLRSPAAWLAALGEPGLRSRARAAFHRLRCSLYEEGPPRAA